MSEPTDGPPGQTIAISAIWPNVDDVPVMPANAFLFSMAPPDVMGASDGLVMTVGYIATPTILGTPEQQRAMLNALGAVPVRTLGRFQMSRGRLQELLQMLQQSADQWDQVLASQARPSQEGEGPQS